MIIPGKKYKSKEFSFREHNQEYNSLWVSTSRAQWRNSKSSNHVHERRLCPNVRTKDTSSPMNFATLRTPRARNLVQCHEMKYHRWIQTRSGLELEYPNVQSLLELIVMARLWSEFFPRELHHELIKQRERPANLCHIFQWILWSTSELQQAIQALGRCVGERCDHQ